MGGTGTGGLGGVRVVRRSAEGRRVVAEGVQALAHEASWPCNAAGLVAACSRTSQCLAHASHPVPQTPGPPSFPWCSGPGGRVVGVVGASHLPGMRELWESGGWRAMVAGGLLDSPTRPRRPETAEEMGVRWVGGAAALGTSAVRGGWWACSSARRMPTWCPLGPLPSQCTSSGVQCWTTSSLSHPLFLFTGCSLPPYPCVLSSVQARAAGRRDPPVVPHRRAAGRAARAGPRAARVARGIQVGGVGAHCVWRCDASSRAGCMGVSSNPDCQDVSSGCKGQAHGCGSPYAPHQPCAPPRRSLAHELYGTTRMLLAVLSREQLAEVCVVRQALPPSCLSTACPGTHVCAGLHCPATHGHGIQARHSRPAILAMPECRPGVPNRSPDLHLWPHPTAPPLLSACSRSVRRAGSATCGTCWRRCGRCGR